MVVIIVWGPPWCFSLGEFACQYRRHEFNPWVRKTPWRRKWQPTPVFLLEESHGQWSLAGYSSWGHKELDMTEQLTLCFHLVNEMIFDFLCYLFSSLIP